MVRAMTMALALVAGPASADPGKDESGKGRERGGYERSYDRGGVPGLADGRPRREPHRASREGGIPRGHLPPPGECRVWDPSRPAGHQSAPHRC